MSHLVNPAMYDADFSRLTSNAQLLELFIRSCRHRTSEGLFHLPLGYVEVDLGMDKVEATQALLELERNKRRFQYDWDRSIVLDLTALRDNPLGRSDKRIPGAISRLKQIDSETPLLKQLWIVAAQYSPDFADALQANFPNIEVAPSETDKGHGTRGMEESSMPRIESIREESEYESESESGSESEASGW